MARFQKFITITSPLFSSIFTTLPLTMR